MREPELIVAVEEGDLARVDALLAAGADPETTNRHGVPALALAAIWGRVKVVRRLLAAGADPGRAAGHQLTTPLMVARNASCVRALIDAGADVNARRDDGVNVIATVVHNADATPPVKRALLEAGADPTVENDASHLCALDSHSSVDRALFVEFGFDPDERPGPRLGIEILLASVRAEAARLGWEVPDDLSPRESRYTRGLRAPARVHRWVD